ncbi:nuclear transport factor 2 family protein [Chryseobacterium jejuense]|uniref:Predicted SnoaL-like aldol condensation-catalyzing enzyme n=1 Tax=Chryseobacterium jejuense TaxID=445960 RepID=A0A2X2VE57_CHRJE|nr:nuclear transport factor 2 family protein [Chryseobacterium jejuense]SDI37500.1 Predicted SnoaL-like aldol condensation-catalyzing enzyme [Chryseobacterium jejuense]SQB26874.1 Predicted ester cyclase [Chryseobacterium jejuense]
MKAKEVVSEMWSALMTNSDPNVIDQYVNPDYRQHSPYVKNGPDGLRDLLATLRPDYRYEPIRFIGDDHFVVMHGIHHNWLNNIMTGGEVVVGIDIFRVENDQIAEHWDASVPIAPASISGRSQFDGPTEITNPELTEVSRKTAEHYVKDVLINKRVEEINQWVSEEVIQHNPAIGDSITALRAALESSEKDYRRIHRIVAEGELVAVQSEGAVRGQVHTFWDVLRIDVTGKIVEMWQVAAVFPDIVPHANGPF